MQRHAVTAYAALTACRRMVSGTISLFYSKCFSPFLHSTGSLSVSREYLALPDGPGRFTQDFSCPALLRIPLRLIYFVYRTITVYGSTFQRVLLKLSCDIVVLQPQHAVTQHWFGLIPVRSPLLGESLLFSFPTGTKMFQFPALASIKDGWHSFRMPGCPIRKSSDQRLFAPTRSLSQLITSFIASESQGIRHAPLFTFFQTYSFGIQVSSFKPEYQYRISKRNGWYILLALY